MEILIIDFRTVRLVHIAKVIKSWGVKVTPVEHFNRKVACGNYDLILLHVGTKQDDEIADDRMNALGHFINRNVLCFSGSSFIDDVVKDCVREKERVWLLKKIFDGSSYTDFNNTIEAQLVRQCIEMIKTGTHPLKIKNKIEGFDPKLEAALEKLYEMLRVAVDEKDIEKIKNERDSYFNSDEYLNSEMTSQ